MNLDHLEKLHAEALHSALGVLSEIHDGEGSQPDPREAIRLITEAIRVLPKLIKIARAAERLQVPLHGKDCSGWHGGECLCANKPFHDALSTITKDTSQ